jgi:Arc/MetJ-type ribon-helix-helix transcriptional regulator
MTDDLTKGNVERREHLLKTVCRNIINNPRRVDADAVDAFRKAVIRYADLQRITPDNLYQSDGEVGVAVRGAWDVIDASNVLKELDDREYSPSTGAAYPRNRWYLDLLRDPDDIDERDDDDDDDDDGVEKQHHASVVANLLVESGRFGSRSEALHHLLHRPGGRALLASLHKAVETEKDPPMESLTAIMKDAGPIAVAKHIVATGRAFGVSESAFVEEASRRASEMYGLPGDRAFAKLCETDGDVVRACGVLKAAEFSVYDIKPVVVGGEDARDVDNATAAVRAYEEIVRIGREKFPFLSADQQFARIFTDRNYAALAAQAHKRPAPTTIYEMPGSPRRATATAYTKSDPAPSVDSAYAELQAKAAELRKTRPELSESQAFAAVYSDRSNIELAKRERVESAPR